MSTDSSRATGALYSTSAVSTSDPGAVRVEDAQPESLRISAPPRLGGPGDGWNPEQLYAAALATCLHQALVLVASTGGHDTAGSAVTATVDLRERGAASYDLVATVRVALPGVDSAERGALVDQAVARCPLAGDWEVEVE